MLSNSDFCILNSLFGSAILTLLWVNAGLCIEKINRSNDCITACALSAFLDRRGASARSKRTPDFLSPAQEQVLPQSEIPEFAFKRVVFTGLRDFWEWATPPGPPANRSAYAYKIGINVMVYAMSHRNNGSDRL